MVEQAQGVEVADRVAEAGKSGPSSSTTKRFRRLSESLTPHQKRALALLTEGKSIPDVAKEIDVNRATVYRWMKTDKYFRAAYNAWQLEQRESYRLTLFKCAQVAVKRIAARVDWDNGLAWKLAKEMGLIARPEPLTADPDQVDLEIQIERLEEQARLEKRRQSPLIAKSTMAAENAPVLTPSEGAGSGEFLTAEECEAEDVLRKVKIGNIAASIVQNNTCNKE